MQAKRGGRAQLTVSREPNVLHCTHLWLVSLQLNRKSFPQFYSSSSVEFYGELDLWFSILNTNLSYNFKNTVLGLVLLRSIVPFLRTPYSWKMCRHGDS